MRLLLTGRHVQITPALRQQLARKLAKLERVLHDSAVSAQVVLTREKYRHVTDITLHARGDHMLSGVGNATTWAESMSEAIEKITLQAQRVKDRWQTRKRRAPGARALPPAIPPAVEEAPAPAETDRVVRVRYAVRLHDLEAALDRLDRSPDPFVLFRNRATGRLALVYRRRDGRAAFIEP
jgi:putative sigma-54 modulation protein